MNGNANCARNTGHASNLFEDTQYTLACSHPTAHLDQVFQRYTTVTHQNFARATVPIFNWIQKEVVHLLIMSINNNFRFSFQTYTVLNTCPSYEQERHTSTI